GVRAAPRLASADLDVVTHRGQDTRATPVARPGRRRLRDILMTANSHPGRSWLQLWVPYGNVRTAPKKRGDDELDRGAAPRIRYRDHRGEPAAGQDRHGSTDRPRAGRHARAHLADRPRGSDPRTRGRDPRHQHRIRSSPRYAAAPSAAGTVQ